MGPARPAELSGRIERTTRALLWQGAGNRWRGDLCSSELISGSLRLIAVSPLPSGSGTLPNRAQSVVAEIAEQRGNNMSQGGFPSIEDLQAKIRSIPDFPKPGILFRDITPLLADGPAFKAAVDAMAAPFSNIDHVVSIESRGFIFGAPMAYTLGAGLVPVRKVGRLPGSTIQEEYELEYGVNTVEIHSDAIKAGQRVIIVDDLLATGGTIRAAVNLVDRLDAELVGVAVLVELSDLKGREKLDGQDVRSLIVY